MKKIYLPLLCFFMVANSLNAQLFEEQSAAIGINHSFNPRALMGGGAAFFDYENDGDDDFYITGGLNKDDVYRNNGDGTFTKILDDIGLGITATYNTTGICTGDIDNDGDRDFFVSTWERNEGTDQPIARNLLFSNNGDGTFSEIGEAAGITQEVFSMGAGFLDYNRDGYLDIYVNNHVEVVAYTYDSTGAINGFDHDCYPNFLYRNNGPTGGTGPITFSEVGADLGVNSLGCTLATIPSDYDLDGDLDLHLANDFGVFLTPNELFQNNYPADNFTDVSESTGANALMFGMGIAAGDYDHDQDLDYYITNLGRNLLLENTAGSFEDVTTFADVENTDSPGGLATSWGTGFFDIDNDSWEDIYVANGRIPSLAQYPTSQNDPDKLFLNNGDKTFSDITDAAGVGDGSYCRGMAYSDFDQDGDLDILVVALNEFGGFSKFYVNEIENNNHYVQFKLIGKETNRDAYGSKIWLFAGGQTFLKELYGGGASHLSQHTSVMHFGLGTIDQVDSIRIEWTNGHVDHLGPFEVDMKHTIEEGIVTGLEDWAAINSLGIEISPNPFTKQITLKLSQPIQNEVSVQLISITGMRVLDKIMRLDEHTILQIEEKLPAGLYTLMIQNKEGSTIQKLIKN